MSRQLLLPFAVCLVCVASASQARATSYNFTQVGPIGNIAPVGITNSGAILFRDLTGSYIYQNGLSTALPGNFGSQAISLDGSSLLGIQLPVPSSGAAEYLLLTSSGIQDTGLNALPGDTFATGLNDPGQIVGTTEVFAPCSSCLPAFPYSFITTGFIRSNGVTSTLFYPSPSGSPQSSYFLAINNSGTILGQGGPTNGFTVQNGHFTDLVPYAPGWTFFPNSINDNGLIVGVMDLPDTAPGRAIATYDNGQYSILDFSPPAGYSSFSVAGLNDQGDILLSTAIYASGIDGAPTIETFLATPITSTPEPSALTFVFLGCSLLVLHAARRSCHLCRPFR